MRINEDDPCSSFSVYGRVTVYGVLLTTLMYFARSGIDHTGFLIIISFSSIVLFLEMTWWKSKFVNSLLSHLLIFVVLMGWVGYMVEKNYVGHIIYNYLTLDAPEMSGRLLAGRFEEMGFDIDQPGTYQITCKPNSIWVTIIFKQEVITYGKIQVVSFLPKGHYRIRIQNDHMNEVDYRIKAIRIK